MTLKQQTIAVIGAGNIGRALIGGLLRGGHVEANAIRATRRNRSMLKQMWSLFPGIHLLTDNIVAVENASLVVVAVKPQNGLRVFSEIGSHLSSDALIVSVLAGLTTDVIAKIMPSPHPVVRTMPNTPILVDEGATAIAGGRHAGPEHVEIVREMFKSVGSVEIVPEHLMDAVTGLSGSGPAYVYMLIEALTDAGVKQGLPRPTAFRLAAQTVVGASRLVVQTRKHPAILRDEVTTPGGTAIAAIAELEAHGLRTMFINAVATATKRSRELSEVGV